MMRHHPLTDRGARALITLPELLKDPKYREFFKTKPKMVKPLPGQMPWRVMIQRQAGGPWAKKETATYADAFRLIANNLRDGRLHDGAIISRGIAFGPPQRIAKVTSGGRPVWFTRNGKTVLDSDGKRIQKTVVVLWKPKLEPTDEPHSWCTYCRRPTVFRWFTSHHALRAAGLQELVDPTDRRCTICAAREDFVRTTLKTARPPAYDPLQHVSKPNRRARK